MAISRDDLLKQVTAQIGAQPMTSDEIDTLLDIARIAAHGTGDRTGGPLATFLVGLAAAGATDRSATIAQLHQSVAGMAPLDGE